MRFFTLPFIISYVLMTQSVFAAPANLAISYLTSWGISGPAEKEIIRSKADILMLSFGKWDANGNILVSNDIVAIPTDTYWINVYYLTWTHFKLGNPNKKVMVAEPRLKGIIGHVFGSRSKKTLCKLFKLLTGRQCRFLGLCRISVGKSEKIVLPIF